MFLKPQDLSLRQMFTTKLGSSLLVFIDNVTTFDVVRKLSLLVVQL